MIFVLITALSIRNKILENTSNENYTGAFVEGKEITDPNAGQFYQGFVSNAASATGM
jgi:hypothetical protein